MRAVYISLGVTLAALLAAAMALSPDPLDYPLNGLEPVFSEEALTVHYKKHHQTYADRFAQALEEASKLSPFLKNVVNGGHTEVMQRLNLFPPSLRTKLTNNGGGFVNHNFFWKCMRPYKKNNAPTPGSALEKAIVSAFGSFNEFKKRFYEVGINVFGSGWAWLYADPTHGPGVFLMETPNQETPLMTGKVPLLTLDVWEHSYYLNFKNMRATYANEWWNLVNWPFVEKRYDQFLADYNRGFKPIASSDNTAGSCPASVSTPILVDNSSRAPAGTANLSRATTGPSVLDEPVDTPPRST